LLDGGQLSGRKGRIIDTILHTVANDAGTRGQTVWKRNSGMTDDASTEPVDPAIIILDCDNTLLDNDALKSNLDFQLRVLLGEQLLEQFWSVYEQVRELTGTVDYPLTLERFRPHIRHEATLKQLRATIMQYPFVNYLYPESLATLDYLKSIALPVIVSDGDTLYQPKKITESGLAEEVDWRVLITIHKEDHLEEIFARWPAPYYVMVDDKEQILAATKARFPRRFVTVHVRQGHYGTDLESVNPAPDLIIDSIGDLRHYRLEDFTYRLLSR
jgi:FMN phosphatase YigB (HAD superfamily)